MPSTTSRLLTLLSVLQTGRHWPGSLLADRLGTSDRTVRRDVERLREMGYRIEASMGPEGGYRLVAGGELPPLLLDDDQTIAIAVALQTASVAGVGVEEAAIRALATIRQVMPSRLRHRMDALEITPIAERPGGGPPMTVQVEVLIALANAIRAHEVLRFHYRSRPGATDDHRPRPTRRVEPHHLANAHGAWYLVAFDLDRTAWRLFSVDRITPTIPTGPRFTPRDVPGGDVQQFVSARFKGSDVNEWSCRGEVVLHLPVDEVLPFVGDGSVRALDEHRCVLAAGSWSWGALAASFGRFEVPMEVVGPPELREAFGVLAQRYAATADPSG